LRNKFKKVNVLIKKEAGEVRQRENETCSKQLPPWAGKRKGPSSKLDLTGKPNLLNRQTVKEERGKELGH